MSPSAPELDEAPARPVSAPSQTPSGPGGHTYGQILKSSVLIGGSQVFNVAIGIVRAKAIAVLLGPGGFGLMGLYTAIANLAQSVAGMGVNSSGVREIAAAVGSGDSERVARTAAVLRRVSVVLGLLGAIALAGLAVPVSRMTFGDARSAAPVALLSLAVLFKIVSDGQAALIQGLRRIPDLARIAVLGGLAGTVVGLGLVFVLRERGVVPALVAMAGATLLASWWYSRRSDVHVVAVPAEEVVPAAAALLKLGSAFMASALFMMGAAYFVRLIVVRKVGVEAAGLYQSAWTIGGLYVGFVLQAMGADFYPRLTAAIEDRRKCNRLVNEQALVSLLLAGPGIIATLTLAPAVLSLLYSPSFLGAVKVLRWICLGATLQVVTWPLGFIIVAEGKRGLLIGVELAYTLAYLLMAWALVHHAGLHGAGIAFFASYAVHALIVYPVVSRLTGFRWSSVNMKMGLALLALIALVFAGFEVLPPWPATGLGLAALVVNAVVSAGILIRLVSPDRLPPPLRRLLARVRIMRPGSPGEPHGGER